MRRIAVLLVFVFSSSFLLASPAKIDRPTEHSSFQLPEAEAELFAPRILLIAEGTAQSDDKEVVPWRLTYSYGEQTTKLVVSALLRPPDLIAKEDQIGELVYKVYFGAQDWPEETVFFLRQEECTPASIESSECRFLDLTSIVHAKLLLPVFTNVVVRQSLQNPTENTVHSFVVGTARHRGRTVDWVGRVDTSDHSIFIIFLANLEELDRGLSAKAWEVVKSFALVGSPPTKTMIFLRRGSCSAYQVKHRYCNFGQFAENIGVQFSKLPGVSHVRVTKYLGQGSPP